MPALSELKRQYETLHNDRLALDVELCDLGIEWKELEREYRAAPRNIDREELAAIVRNRDKVAETIQRLQVEREEAAKAEHKAEIIYGDARRAVEAARVTLLRTKSKFVNVETKAAEIAAIRTRCKAILEKYGEQP